MSAIRVDTRSRVVQLDRRATPDERFTEEHAKDPSRLARVLMRLLQDVATLKRRFHPRRIDFEDVAVDDAGTTVYSFAHGFNGRVRWWVVDWSGASAGPQLVRADATDAHTLALVSYEIGTATIRVEEAG